MSAGQLTSSLPLNQRTLRTRHAVLDTQYSAQSALDTQYSEQSVLDKKRHTVSSELILQHRYELRAGQVCSKLFCTSTVS